MKSQKGVTMLSLILYVASFVVVTTVVAGITTFFYSNIKTMDTTIGSNSSYNKFNLYMINECKKPNVQLYAIKGHSTSGGDILEIENVGASTDGKNFDYIAFKTDSGINSFIYDSENHDLYYNSIKLCDDIYDFQLQLDKTTGKDVINVLINIDGTSFQTKYVVGS